MRVCTDIGRQTLPIHRNQAPSFSLRHLTEPIGYQNHWGKFPNGLFGSKLQGKHFIFRWLQTFLPLSLSRWWPLQQLGPVRRYIAPAQEDQRTNIIQRDPEQEQILRWQWSCSKGNAVSHKSRQNFAAWPSGVPSVPVTALRRLVRSLSVRLSHFTSALVLGAVLRSAPGAGRWAARSHSQGQMPNYFESMI